jgi:DNA adenine methylase
MTIHKSVQLHTPSPGKAGKAALTARPPARPLLKWAGGKRQLLPALSRTYPITFDRYVEPFFGSGAVFFDLSAAGRLDGRRAILADVNPDLIGCYRIVRDRTEEVVQALETLAREHRRGGDEHYYKVRDLRFNPWRAAMTERAGNQILADAYTPELAAMLIFLNRTGFNGLFRLNRDGAFNVPAGRYADPRICQVEHVRAVAGVFRRPGVSIELSPFERTLAATSRGDFVYCDPPYAPLTRTSSFASYTAEGFGVADQQRLAQAVFGACGRGASVVLSNSSARDIVDLYSAPAARAAGLRIARVPARRAINSRASSRGVVDELIITNVGVDARSRTLAPVIRMAKVTAARVRTRTA